MLEQEVKLTFDTADAARAAVTAAGGRLVAPPRLLDDRLFDWPDRRLQQAGATCRIRRDGDRAFITFKGRAQDGPVKTREEIETSLGSAEIGEALLAALGLVRCFRAEKHREEYALDTAIVTVDHTPIGVFVEIEGAPDAIARVAARLGRTPADYRLESYPRLYLNWCAAQDLVPGDMVFK